MEEEITARSPVETSVLIERNVMCLEAMVNLIAVYHRKQKDKGGQPYMLHPIYIMMELLKKYPGDYELAAIGAGHDLLEDTTVTPEQMRSVGITERVIAGIQTMTKIKGENPEEYLTRLMLNWDTVRVKLEDLKHNMDVLRIKRELSDKDLQRINKYRRMHHVLSQIKYKKGETYVS